MTKEKALIQEVFTSSKGHSTPVLLKFQNGDLNTTHKESTLYFPMKCAKKKKQCAVVIASGNVYSGVVGESGLTSELTDTYICVRNKESNKIRILPIDQVKLNNHVYQEKEKTTYAALTKENSFAISLRNFGGRKDMRYLANQERNKVSIDVVQDQLENTVEASEVLETTDEVVSADNNVERIRPPFNKDAITLENVFNLYDIIPLELIERLDQEASVLLSTEIKDIPISSEYLQNAIKTLKKDPQSNETLLKLKIIIYMDALQTLMKTKSKSLKRLELSKITEKVENDIRERFSDTNLKLKVRTSFSNEKALCYYLVLAFLLSEKYELDLDMLSLEVCMPRKKILQFAQLINATTKPRTNSLMLRLPSSMKPLIFANGKAKRRK